MKKLKDVKLFYWFIVFSLLLIPITNSFFVNIAKLIRSIKSNGEYEIVFKDLKDENKKLTNKLRYYNSTSGLKVLIKDRLNQVEEGEVLIKFGKPNKNLIKVK